MKHENKRERARPAPRAGLPHSWSIESWPSDVYPHGPKSARYLVRVNRDALIAAGALTRVGREIVILGAGYAKWLMQGDATTDGVKGPSNLRSREEEHENRSRL